MTKFNFAALVWGVVACLLFGVGMCMCLLPEWNAFNAGVVCAAVGFVALIALWITLRRGGKGAVRLEPKLVGKIAFAVFAALVMGVGMCMVMVWDMMLWGILVGIVGIILLLCLIPMIKGWKEKGEKE